MYIYRGKLNFKFSNKADNEGITVVFPSGFRFGDPVYTCWQWTVTSEDNRKEPCFRSGTINELSISSTCKVGFCYDDPYSFNATFSKDLKTLSLVMRAANGDTGEPTDLHLVYPSDPTVPPAPDPADPRIYVGKFQNFAPSADDEMLVVVAPGSMDEGKTICAFWQWTQAYSGNEKENADQVTTISNVQNVAHVGPSFSFRYLGNNNYYTFDLTVREMDDQLTLKITDQQQVSTGDLTLYLEAMSQPSSLQKLAIFNHTTQVYNDSKEIVICSLKASGTGLTDQILAVAGLILGAVGFVACLPISIPTTAAVDIFIATVSLCVSVGGAVQVYNSSGEETSAVMFPGDTIKRTSDGSIVFSNNDLHIMLVRIDPDRRLVISTATIEKLGDTTQNLSKVLPEAEAPPVYKDLLALQLPTDMRLMASRTIIVPSLKAKRVARKKDVTNMKPDDVPNALATFTKPTSTNPISTLDWYGTLDEYYETKSDEPFLFEYDSGVDLVFSQGDTMSGERYATILYATNELRWPLKTVTVLKLTNCIIRGGGEKLSLGVPTDEEAVKRAIARTSYWGYGWSRGFELVAYVVPDETTNVLHTHGLQDYVYFVVYCNPILSLLPK